MFVELDLADHIPPTVFLGGGRRNRKRLSFMTRKSSLQ